MSFLQDGKDSDLFLPYAHTAEYRAFLGMYVEGLKKIRMLISYDSKLERIDKEREALKEILEKTYRSIKDRFFEANNAKMTAIEKAYKNTKNVYKDPQVEFLRRQDFDLAFSMMDVDEVKDLLSDETKDLSDYELLKIKVTHGHNVKVFALLHERELAKEDDYQRDSDYQRMSRENAVLSAIDRYGLAMVYVPAVPLVNVYTNFLDAPYRVLDLSFENLGDADYYGRLVEMEELLKDFKVIKATNGGLETLRATPKLKYDEFDGRIFRGGEDFEEKIRFEWLKERFNETTTNRFDPSRADYDIVRHIRFLEKRLVRKLQSEPDYAERYRQAMVEATKSNKWEYSGFAVAEYLYSDLEAERKEAQKKAEGAESSQAEEAEGAEHDQTASDTEEAR